MQSLPKQSDTLDNPTILTVVKMSPFYLNSYLMLVHLHLHFLEVNDNLPILKSNLVNNLKQFVRTGILAVVMVIRVIMAGITTYAASVVNITEIKTEVTAIQPSTNAINNKEQQQLVRAAHKAQEAKSIGTRQLKCKALVNISEILCYK